MCRGDFPTILRAWHGFCYRNDRAIGASIFSRIARGWHGACDRNDRAIGAETNERSYAT